MYNAALRLDDFQAFHLHHTHDNIQNGCRSSKAGGMSQFEDGRKDVNLW